MEVLSTIVGKCGEAALHLKESQQTEFFSGIFNGLKFKFALHRIFSFYPLIKSLGIESCLKFVAYGIYLSDRFERLTLECGFCDFVVDFPESFSNDVVENIKKTHSSKCNLHQRIKNDVSFNPAICINYKFEAHRLFSYLEISWKSPVSIFDLAKNGFYYASPDDNVRCAFCNLEVRGWEKCDVVDKEHRRWNPLCPFLTMPQNVGNVEIGKENWTAGQDCVSSLQRLDELYGKVELFNKGRKSANVESLGIQKFNHDIKFSKMSLLDSRLKSFKDWPKSLTQTPQVLASCGFFYTGIGDRVSCFFCGLGLKDWATNDSPFEQHALWSSTCQFLISLTGLEFVRNTLHKPLHCELKTNDNPADTYALNRNQRSVKSCALDICNKCENNEINTVNLPCGHMNFCTDCCGENICCGTCGIELFGKVNVFTA